MTKARGKRDGAARSAPSRRRKRKPFGPVSRNTRKSNINKRLKVGLL